MIIVTNTNQLNCLMNTYYRFVMVNPKPRTVQKLREQWKRMKIQSKKAKKKSKYFSLIIPEFKNHTNSSTTLRFDRQKRTRFV